MSLVLVWVFCALLSCAVESGGADKEPPKANSLTSPRRSRSPRRVSRDASPPTLPLVVWVRRPEASAEPPELLPEPTGLLVGADRCRTPSNHILEWGNPQNEQRMQPEQRLRPPMAGQARPSTSTRMTPPQYCELQSAINAASLTVTRRLSALLLKLCLRTASTT